MPKFVLVYRGGGMPESEADQAGVMEAWGAWFGTLGDAVVDMGNPTSQSKTLVSDGSTTDGTISGYSLINATDLASAVSLAKGCPILSAGGSVEVGETIEM
jgi:hypothetical protein